MSCGYCTNMHYRKLDKHLTDIKQTYLADNRIKSDITQTKVVKQTHIAVNKIKR